MAHGKKESSYLYGINPAFVIKGFERNEAGSICYRTYEDLREKQNVPYAPFEYGVFSQRDTPHPEDKFRRSQPYVMIAIPDGKDAKGFDRFLCLKTTPDNVFIESRDTANHGNDINVRINDKNNMASKPYYVKIGHRADKNSLMQFETGRDGKYTEMIMSGDEIINKYVNYLKSIGSPTIGRYEKNDRETVAVPNTSTQLADEHQMG